MSKPLVTVFITVYNTEMYIGECLQSILNQTYRNIEVLIIDDGSTDKSIDIITSFNDDRIRLIKNEKNMGIPYNRQKGVELARGKYMAILDADDISMLNRIERQVEYMEENLDVLVTGTFYKVFGERRLSKYYKVDLNSEEMKANLIFRCPILNSSAMIRLEKMKELGINYNLNHFIAQDYGLWAEISKKEKIETIPEVLVDYRFGHENITKTTNEKKAIQRKKIIDSIHNDLLDFHGFNLTEREKEIFNYFFYENDPQLDKFPVNEAEQLMQKLITINKNKSIFNESVFMSILNNSIEISMKYSSLSYKKKVSIWRKTSNKGLLYIAIKAMYFSIFQFAKKCYRLIK